MKSIQTKSVRIIGSLIRALVCSTLLTLTPVLAATWEWDVSTDLGLIYTDNLRLQTPPFDESDTVVRIAPTIRLAADDDRIEADMRYSPEAYFYGEDSDANEVFHIVDAELTATLVRNALFLYLSGTNFQTMVSPDVPFQLSNLPITGNRVDSTILEARPYWEQNLGFADVLALVEYVDTRYDQAPTSIADSVQDNTIKRGMLDVNNYSRQQGFALGFEYAYNRVEYELATPWDYQQASVSIGYWVNGTTRIFVSGGLESSYENILDPSLKDELWEAGFQYAPNARLNLVIAAGERSFGSSIRADLSYRQRRGETTLSYSETPVSRADLARDNRRPLSETDSLNAFLDRPGESDRFVRKVGQFQTMIGLPKTDLTLRVFLERRDQRTSDLGTPLGDERLGGAALRWSWRFGSRSTLGFDTDIARREEFIDTVEFESVLTRFSADFSFQLSRRMRLILLAQRTEEDSDDGSARNYTENQYRLTLRTEFL